VVKLTTVQVTKLPLQRKIRKRGMICFEKPVLAEEFYIRGSAKGRIFNNLI
jgi:hypothetical protein